MLALEQPDLPFAEQLLLWGIRVWVAAFNGDENAAPILREGFGLAGVLEADRLIEPRRDLAQSFDEHPLHDY